jgi:hypothetical protein
MSFHRPLPLVLAVAVTAACTKPKDVSVVYAHAVPASGAIEVQLNDPSRSLTVTVNDALVVDRKFSRRARIEGVPAGIARVHVATGGGCEKGGEFDREVEVFPGETVVVALPGPEPNSGCAVWAGLNYVGVQIGMVALAVLTVGAVSRAPSHK